MKGEKGERGGRRERQGGLFVVVVYLFPIPSLASSLFSLFCFVACELWKGLRNWSEEW